MSKKIEMEAERKNIEQKLDREIASFLNRFQKKDLQLPKKRAVTYSEFLSDKMLIIRAIREGIPYSLFHLIQHYAPFNENDWAWFLDISTKSLQRYKQASKSFKPLQSEKIIEMAEVTNIGLDVFGSMEKFKLWLHSPVYVSAPPSNDTTWQDKMIPGFVFFFIDSTFRRDTIG